MVGVARIRYSLALTQATRVRVPAELTQLPFAAPCSSHLPAADSFFLEHEAERLDRFNYSTHLFSLQASFLDGFHSSSCVCFPAKKSRGNLAPSLVRKPLKRTVKDTDFSSNAWPA